LYAASDAAIVAVPTIDHFSTVRSALEADLDVLVEKPLAATVEQGEQLLRLARDRGRLLQVGHQERFNPALRMIRERICSPRFVEAHRLNSFPDRATDIDVVRDLMIHDIDILQQLIGAPPDRVEAIGIPVITPQVDIANARLVFPDGCIANLTASRVSVTPMRKIRFFQRDGYFSIDFLSQSVSIFRRLTDEGDGAPRIDMEELEIDPDDALVAQLRAFTDAMRTRSTSGVTGLDALSALGTAHRVIDAMPPLEQLR
jgi:predicted dehydrogenase